MTKETDAAHYHHGNLRAALMRAAEQLLAKQGVAGLSLRAVARQAGVSHAAPYRHFRDKAALLEAVARSDFERLAVAIRGAGDGVPNNTELKLIEAGVAYVRQAVGQPVICQLMLGGRVEFPGDLACPRATGPVFKALVRLIREGISTGVFRDRDPQELALVAWAAMHGLAVLMVARLQDAGSMRMDDIDEQVRAVMRNVIYGISK